MKVMDGTQERHLSLLVDLAGDPGIVQEALKLLSQLPQEKQTSERLLVLLLRLITRDPGVPDEIGIETAVQKLIELRKVRSEPAPVG